MGVFNFDWQTRLSIRLQKGRKPEIHRRESTWGCINGYFQVLNVTAKIFGKY